MRDEVSHWSGWGDADAVPPAPQESARMLVFAMVLARFRGEVSSSSGWDRDAHVYIDAKDRDSPWASKSDRNRLKPQRL